jgi:hypothetical protein
LEEADSSEEDEELDKINKDLVKRESTIVGDLDLSSPDRRSRLAADLYEAPAEARKSRQLTAGLNLSFARRDHGILPYASPRHSILGADRALAKSHSEYHKGGEGDSDEHADNIIAISDAESDYVSQAGRRGNQIHVQSVY